MAIIGAHVLLYTSEAEKVRLPGGLEVELYEPRHPVAINATQHRPREVKARDKGRWTKGQRKARSDRR